MRRRGFIAALGGVAASMTWNLQLGLAETRGKRALLAYLSSATQAEASEFIGIFLNDGFTVGPFSMLPMSCGT